MEIIFLLIALAIYFIPTWVGYNHRNAGSIFVLNLFFGWTFIGWIVALIWAVSNDSKPQPIVFKNEVKISNSDELIKLKKLLDDGVLTKEEFEAEKNKILKK